MLDVEVNEGIATARLARPPANALNLLLLEEMRSGLSRLAETDVRAIVITGTGRFFSAGIDLFELLDYDGASFKEFAAAFDSAFSGFFALDKPIVAAVNGHAIAGGAVLAATADFRFMSQGEARLGLTEIQVGVAFPTSALEAVRTSWAGPYLNELLYRGLTYDAEAARARGLVDEVVGDADLAQRANERARELALHAPVAFAATKRALRHEARARIHAACAAGFDPIWNSWQSPETRARIEAYRQRAIASRKPKGAR